jgi:hypothetical protein
VIDPLKCVRLYISEATKPFKPSTNAALLGHSRANLMPSNVQEFGRGELHCTGFQDINAKD